MLGLFIKKPKESNLGSFIPSFPLRFSHIFSYCHVCIVYMKGLTADVLSQP